jgi:hypothetical protein
MTIEWSRDEENVNCILAHRCKCDDLVTCWYKTAIDDEWKTGFFHQWSQNYEEFESGPGNFPAAIIEDATNSQVHVVYAGWVSFSPDSPDGPEVPIPKDESGWLGEAAAAGEAARENGKRCPLDETADLTEYLESGTPEGFTPTPHYFPDGDFVSLYVSNERCYADRIDDLLTVYYSDTTGKIVGCKIKGVRQVLPEDWSKPNQAITRAPEKSKRFKPRLEWCAHTLHWVLQVHPNAIEVFNDDADYICQVRWIDGEMDYSQGGLPLSKMSEMFEEAECEVAHQEGRSRRLKDFIADLRGGA